MVIKECFAVNIITSFALSVVNKLEIIDILIDSLLGYCGYGMQVSNKIQKGEY
jgi:hypothetical protein